MWIKQPRSKIVSEGLSDFMLDIDAYKSGNSRPIQKLGAVRRQRAYSWGTFQTHKPGGHPREQSLGRFGFRCNSANCVISQGAEDDSIENALCWTSPERPSSRRIFKRIVALDALAARGGLESLDQVRIKPLQVSARLECLCDHTYGGTYQSRNSRVTPEIMTESAGK